MIFAFFPKNEPVSNKAILFMCDALFPVTVKKCLSKEYVAQSLANDNLTTIGLMSCCRNHGQLNRRATGGQEGCPGGRGRAGVSGLAPTPTFPSERRRPASGTMCLEDCLPSLKWRT